MLRTFALAAALGMVAAAAQAENHDVLMLNMGEKGLMVFEPDYVHVQPGDTVTFVPTDPSHNAQSIPEMMPEGAEPFDGGINEEVTVTFDQEGIYGIKCLPHYGMGMVAVVQVGEDTTNLEEASAVSHPGLAANRMEEALAQVQ